MMPANNRMRVLHYRGREELFFLVNEGDEAYEGSVFLPVKGSVTAYDAWNNEILPCDAQSCPGGVHVALNLQPRKSLMLLVNAAMSADIPIHKASAQLDTLHGTEMKAFSRSVCRSIDYPHFGEAEAVILPDVLSRQMPDFSGYIRYDSTFKAQSNTPCFIVITEPCEAVEVFVNGISAGIQVTPAYIFDVSRLIQDGENHLRIELATTLERENLQLAGKSSREAAPTGLTGTVKVYRHGRSINEPVER